MPSLLPTELYDKAEIEGFFTSHDRVSIFFHSMTYFLIIKLTHSCARYVRFRQRVLLRITNISVSLLQQTSKRSNSSPELLCYLYRGNNLSPLTEIQYRIYNLLYFKLLVAP